MSFDFAQFKRIAASAEYHKFLALDLVEGDAELGRCVIKLAYDQKYSIFAEPGTYHGGVIAALVDVTGAIACGLKVGRPTPTCNMRIDFLDSPAKVDLIAEGIVRRFGKSIAVADVEIRDAAGKVYSIGRGTFSTAAAFRAIEQGGGSAQG